MHESGVPGWLVAVALAAAFSAAVVAVAIVTGLFVILLPALAIVALGYGLYAGIAASRRRRFGAAWDRIGVVRDGRTLRRRWRLPRQRP